MQRRLITTDCHIAVPYSLVEELPESYREFFPRVDRREEGTFIVSPAPVVLKSMMGDQAGRGIPVEDDPRVLARAAVMQACPESNPSFDPAETMAELESDGVYGAVAIGRFAVLETGTPAEADAAYCRVVNDWLADKWGPYLDRVAPGIFLPYKDVALSVKELERAAGLGLRPALLPDGIFDRPYYLEEWEPLWEAANSLKIPFTLHVGALRQPAANFKRPPYPGANFVQWYSDCVGMGETLGWLVYSGVFERYPDLHVVMTEGYAAWLGFAMQFFDHHWSDSRYRNLSMRGPEPKLEAPPSFYLKRQAHATFMWDPIAIANREITGNDCLLWGNDYPHFEGSFPYSADWIDKQFAGVPEDEIDQIVRGNASRIFNIKV